MLRPGLTWGIGFYLVDFKVPGTSHTAQLFANVSKVWTQGDVRTGMNMAGYVGRLEEMTVRASTRGNYMSIGGA
jgi:hypothetical protein